MRGYGASFAAGVLLVLAASVGVAGCNAGIPAVGLDDVPGHSDVVVDVGPGPLFDSPHFDIVSRDNGDTMVHCVLDTDCAGTPETPRCERATGICRACLPTPDTCAAGSYCDGTFHCAAGCADDSECAAGSNDAGVVHRRCDVAAHACVDCLADNDCPASMVCSTHRCVPGCSDVHACPSGTDCCNGACLDLFTDALHCGSCAHACDTGGACCGGVCFDTTSDPRHCGACDTRCAAANGVAGCSAGACSVASCLPGFGDCDHAAANGCEANVVSDANHCGACTTSCMSGPNLTPACIAGICASSCSGAFIHCSSNAADGCEIDPRSDRMNCGACGVVCSGAHSAGGCVSGACTVTACDPGFGDCNRVASDGCEVGTASDPYNCGACLNVCPAGPFATATCTAGACGVRCLAGHADCDGIASNGCETDLGSDPSHCGTCATSCPSRLHATAACTAGVCDIYCSGSYRDCDGNAANGCEVDALSDAAHCGTCGNACTAPHAALACTGGACTLGSCASGWGNCNGIAADGCETSTQSDLLNCGGCFRSCPNVPFAAPTCGSGVCGFTCLAGRADCNGVASDGCESALASDAANCGTCGHACSAGQVCDTGVCAASCSLPQLLCSGACIDTVSNVANCGACGRVCSLAHATAACSGGACAVGTCSAGYGNCNGTATDGCETPLTSDPANCGACFSSCPTGPFATAVCASGACGITCTAGHGNCDGVAATGCEAIFATDPLHCGSCGGVCPTPAGATAACTAGVCGFTCATGFRDCDGVASNGCEIDTRSSVANCGGCGVACTAANAVSGCVASHCTLASCATGFANCNGILTDGCEVATGGDSNNCGSCGNICTGGTICVAGACTLVNPFPSTGAEGAFAPSANVTLAPGVHNFTTINVPAGVTVTTSGSGVLDLRASGDVTVAGTLDVSGGTGGTGVRATGGGGGGFTASLQTAGIAAGGTGGLTPAGNAAVGCSANAPGGSYGGGAGTVGTLTVGGGGGGGPGGGAGGLVGGTCVAGAGGGGATAGAGGQSGGPPYDGQPGQTGMDACGGLAAGGGGGSIGRTAAGDLAMTSTFQAGSGGGGGSGSYGTGLAAAEGGGGGGGGAIRISSPTRITVSGTLRADGGAGGNGSDANPTCFGAEGGSGGGGGSGGAIYLATPVLSVSGTISAAGGAGGHHGANVSGGDGGAGAIGRVRISASLASCTLGGTVVPALRSACNANTTAGYPYIAAYPR